MRRLSIISMLALTCFVFITVAVVMINNNNIDSYETETLFLQRSITDIATQNTTYDGKQYSYKNPIIPKGFKPVSNAQDVTVTSNWDNLKTDSNEYKKGMVIEDSIGNQFVWIGVDGYHVKFEKLDWLSSSGLITGFYNTIEKEDTPEYLTMKESIQKYQGFYVARFLAGNPSQGNATENNYPIMTKPDTLTDGTAKPVSKRDYLIWKYIPWGTTNNEVNPGNGAVTVARGMYPKNETTVGVSSTLCYDIQWDMILQFIELSNYNFEGKMKIYDKDQWISGDIEQNKLSNIYDIGSLPILTMGKYSKNANVIVTRSYQLTDGGSPSMRSHYANFDKDIFSISFRTTLYVK